MRLVRAVTAAALSFAAAGFSPAVPTVSRSTGESGERHEIVAIDEMIDTAAQMMDASRGEDAIRTLTLVLEIQPGNGLAHANRAMASAWTNRLDTRWTNFTEAHAAWSICV